MADGIRFAFNRKVLYLTCSLARFAGEMGRINRDVYATLVDKEVVGKQEDVRNMLLKNDSGRFEEIYEIYQEAFPPIEKRTKSAQEAVFKNPYYRLYVIEERGRILAFLGCWHLPSCCFVEHLATTKACRGKGYGKDLVEECLADTDKPVFLEIESIIDADPMTAHRAGFYERLGFYVNRFPYQQMPLKTEDDPMTLWIMSYGEPISEEAFRPYKKEIYQMVYQVEL